MGVDVKRHAPAALSPRKTTYPLYRRLGRPQGRYGRVRNILPPQGFDPRTAQPVASCYGVVDRAIPPHYLLGKKVKSTLEQAAKAQRGSRGIALLFL